MTLYAMPGPTPGERQTGIIDPVLHAEREGEKMQRLADAEQHKGEWKWDTGPANPDRQRAMIDAAEWHYALKMLYAASKLLQDAASDEATWQLPKEQRSVLLEAARSMWPKIAKAKKARNAAQDKYESYKRS